MWLKFIQEKFTLINNYRQKLSKMMVFGVWVHILTGIAKQKVMTDNLLSGNQNVTEFIFCKMKYKK